MTKKILASLIFASVILTILPEDSFSQRRRNSGTKNIKIGLQRWVNNISYTYETRVSKEGTFEEIKLTSQGAMPDTELLLEYVLSQRVGIEVGVGIIPAVRDFELKAESQSVGEIKQTLSMKYLFGINAYFSAIGGNGFKPFSGIGVGSFSVASAYKNGGRVNSNLSEKEQSDLIAIFPEKQTVVTAVQGQYLKLGVDWLIDAAGLRLQYIYLQDAKMVREMKTLTLEEQKQKETISIQGGISLSVFFTF